MDNAFKGHVPSILKVAELQHTGSGFGKIKYNPTQGRRWVEYAAGTSGSPKAKEALRRLIVREERTKDQLQQLTRYGLFRGETLAFDFDPTGNGFRWDSKGGSIRGVAGRDDYNTVWDPANQQVKEAPDNQSLNRGQKSPSGRFHDGTRVVPRRFPQIASRFELNYAVKAVLDGKMQRKITDPISRPIYEYAMVSKTPMPHMTNGAAQHIALAEVANKMPKVSLDTHINGKTYKRGGASLADLPVVPTPVGTVRPYQDDVDEQHDAVEDVLLGPKVAMINLYQTAMDQKEQSFWPKLTTSDYELVEKYRKAYRKTIGDQDVQGRKLLATHDDLEFHGRYEGPNENLMIEELDERSDFDFQGVAPHHIYHGSDEELTLDEEMELDNVRRVNIHLQTAREYGTPVDSGGRFPYNGLPRRNFFLSDPFNLMKPWLCVNAEGTDQGEQVIPESPHKMILNHAAESTMFNSMPFDVQQDFLPDHELQPIMDQHDQVYFKNTHFGSNPHSPTFLPEKAFVDNYYEDQKMLARMHNPSNYLYFDDFKATYDLLNQKSPHDKSMLFNNDVINIKKMPRVDPNNPKAVAAQVEDLGKKFFLVYKAKMLNQVFHNLPYEEEAGGKYDGQEGWNKDHQARVSHPDFHGLDTVEFPDDMTNIADRIQFLRENQSLSFANLPQEWVTQGEYDRALAEDGHGLGPDPTKIHMAAQVEFDPNKNEHMDHPADGSPMKHTPYTKVRTNHEYFVHLCLPVVGEVDVGDSDEVAYDKIMKATHSLVMEHATGEPAEGSSDDETKYQQCTPYIRPYIQYQGAHNPFWNRTVPNPSIWNMGPNNNRHYNRAQMSYEAQMWNDYAEGKMTRDDIDAALADNGNFDIMRATPYFDVNSTETDYEGTYTREQVHDKLASGRFTVVKRSDVVIDKPVKDVVKF